MPHRRKFICGNWKMNGTASEAAALVAGIVGSWKEAYRTIEIAICPPFTALLEVHSLISGRGVHIALGAQNCSHEPNGAFTGEISARMLVEANCTYVILGHSERRTIFGESDDMINRKLLAALSAGLKPIFCVGETLEERELNQTYEVLLRQIKEGLRGVKAIEMKNVTIAYEPVWAIGTGRTATPEIAQNAHSFIRMEVAKLYSDDIAGNISIQYGGSMKPGNARELLTQPDIDGGLIGGASLDAKQFLAIADTAL